MAPFIVNHPTLLSNWILARETALKTIREIKNVKSEDIKLFKNCLKKSIKNITSWNTDSEYQKKKIKSLLNDLNKFIQFIEKDFNFSTNTDITALGSALLASNNSRFFQRWNLYFRRHLCLSLKRCYLQ